MTDDTRRPEVRDKLNARDVLNAMEMAKEGCEDAAATLARLAPFVGAAMAYCQDGANGDPPPAHVQLELHGEMLLAHRRLARVEPEGSDA